MPAAARSGPGTSARSPRLVTVLTPHWARGGLCGGVGPDTHRAWAKRGGGAVTPASTYLPTEAVLAAAGTAASA